MASFSSANKTIHCHFRAKYRMLWQKAVWSLQASIELWEDMIEMTNRSRETWLRRGRRSGRWQLNTSIPDSQSKTPYRECLENGECDDWAKFKDCRREWDRTKISKKSRYAFRAVPASLQTIFGAIDWSLRDEETMTNNLRSSAVFWMLIWIRGHRKSLKEFPGGRNFLTYPFLSFNSDPPIGASV
jgi:hypothetical protein